MRYQVTINFTTDILGTVPMNKDIYVDYIASKDGAPSAAVAEADTVPLDDKGKTGFHRDDDGIPFLYDYVIKGFLKDACGMLWRVEDSLSKKVKAYKRIIDGLVFVDPRIIRFTVAGSIGELQRPLRAQTAQGERVALAFSETIPAGSTVTFALDVLDDKSVPEELIGEWLDYGKYRGLGQWRNASYGRFTYTLAK
jgi:hypothetical protein